MSDKDIILTINTINNKVISNKNTIGCVGENMQGDIIVDFKKDFINGECWLETQCNNNKKGYILMTRQENNTYTAPIKSCLLQQAGAVKFQIRIIQGNSSDTEKPTYKSEVFSLNVNESINAIDELPDVYPTIIEVVESQIALKADIEYVDNQINTKLGDLDNILIELNSGGGV